MNTGIINRLEKELIDIFGDKATLAVTVARVSNKGYMTRIGAQGMPFEISAYDKDIENTQKIALKEFEKQMETILKEKMRPTLSLDKYVDLKLDLEDFYSLYRHEEWVVYEDLKVLREKTKAKMCRLNNEKYECIINSPYMNLCAKGIGRTKEKAISSAIHTAFNVFRPSLIKVGDRTVYK